MPEQSTSEETQPDSAAIAPEPIDVPKTASAPPASIAPYGTDWSIDDRSPRISLQHIALFCVLLTGLLLRLSAARHLSSHVDESASIMAAWMTADKGVPIYPSGTFYTQGATISYLLAPIVKLGYGDIDHLYVMRLLSVFTGTLAIVALYFLSKWLLRSTWVAIGIAFLLAIDPASVRWSGLVRMYATLQFITLVMLFLFLHILRYPATRKYLIAFVAAFWFGVFTHIAICLLLPPMLLLAVWKHRLDLAGRRIDLTVALGAAMLAPFTLLFLNFLVSPKEATPAGESSKISFVGDFILSIDQILAPTLKSWQLLFDYSSYGVLVPFLILGLTLLLIGRYFLDANLPEEMRERRNIFGTLLVLYWIPILIVGALATESNERYLLHLHPLGLILIGFGIQELVAGELRQPTMVFAPATQRPVEIAGHTISLRGSDINSRFAWLTVPRLITTAACFIIAFGALLRVFRYVYWSMWLDEGFALLYSQQSWKSVVGLNGFYSPHPPLYFSLTKVFNLVFSDASAGRTLSLVCGLLTLPFFYLLARRLMDPIASLIATLVFVLSPIHIYYSQEARMYALVVLTVTVSYYALVSFLQTGNKWYAVLYGGALVVAAYGDYSALFAIAPQIAIILYMLWRNWRRMVPIILAGVAAVLLYAPWLPQVWHSVNSANEDERRSEYLGAGFSRVLIIVLRITGVASDQTGPYFPSLQPTAWDNFDKLHLIILLGMAPVVILGLIGLWRRWMLATTTMALLGTIVVTAVISVVSPSFAERSVLSVSVGWALLLGAAFNGKRRRSQTFVATASLLFILLICLNSINIIQTYGVKSRWDDAAADLAESQPLHYPVVTYSYGEVANTLVEAYEPGLLNDERLITVRDGVLEKTLSNDILPHTGITVADVDGGKLNELLPDTPDNDYVWFLYYQRIGQENVEQGIIDAGYTRIIQKTYISPRNQVFLDLYARPNATTEIPIASVPDFTNGLLWGIPPNASLVKTAEDGQSVSIQNISKNGTAIATQVSASGPALFVFDGDVQTVGGGNQALVTLSCLSDTSVVLNESTGSTPGRRGLLHHRSAVVCPEGTSQVRITILNISRTEHVWSNVSMGSNPIVRSDADYQP